MNPPLDTIHISQGEANFEMQSISYIRNCDKIRALPRQTYEILVNSPGDYHTHTSIGNMVTVESRGVNVRVWLKQLTETPGTLFGFGKTC